MSILNRTNDGFFNVVLVIYHIVLEEITIDKETLIKRCAPGVIENKDVGNTLRKWTELGLFSEIEEEGKTNIVIPEEYSLKKRQPFQKL